MYSVIELPLEVEPWQAAAIDKKMECARKVYNQMLSKNLKKYGEMVKTREWKELCRVIREELSKEPKKKSEALKEAYARKNEIMKASGFSDFSFRSQAIAASKYYQKHVSSKMADMSIGHPMWAAFEKLFFGNGEAVHFKRAGEAMSLASDNKSGMRFVNEGGSYFVVFSNMAARAKVVRVKVKGPKTEYDCAMLRANVKVLRVVKKIEKGRGHYYCQLTVDREPYAKVDENGELVHPIGEGPVGLAVWRDKLCAVSSDRTEIFSLSPYAPGYAEKRDELTRKLEHLRRVNNPDNYNEDGTVKNGIVGEDGKRHRLTWVETNHYKKVRAELRELHRVYVVKRNLHHNKIVWELLSMGDSFKFADTSFLTKKPEWDESEPAQPEECVKRKQRAKAIQECAPSELLAKLDAKLEGAHLAPIARHKLPEELYWYRHDVGTSGEDLFQGEQVVVHDEQVDQTLYRAYLALHYDEGAKRYDERALDDGWESFVRHAKVSGALLELSRRGA